VQRHPVGAYFGLAFGISWIGVLIAMGPEPIPAPPERAQQRFVFVYLAMLVGPPTAGILMTAVVGGTGALRDYLRRLLAWRVAPRWYALALFTAPIAVLTTDGLLSLLSRDFTPSVMNPAEPGGLPLQASNRLTFVLMSMAVGIGAGLFEELGWTGFATPQLRARHSALVAGLILGILWGAWHFLAVFWGSAVAFGDAPVPLFMFVALFSFLPPYRLLMVRLYDATGSTLVAILTHASLTTSMLTFGPQVTGTGAILNNVMFSCVLWGIAGMALGPRPLHRSQAAKRTPTDRPVLRRRPADALTTLQRRDAGATRRRPAS
jgi:membrane protease YdiL (CAAX protease family)